MGDGVYTLSTSLLHSLLEKERNANLRADAKHAKTVLPELSKDPKCVTSSRRDREARWICAMGRRLALDFSTVSVAITVFDRVLETVVVQTKYVNCVALTCLYLAVKLHEECFASPCREYDSSNTSPLMDCDRPQLSIFDANNLSRILHDNEEEFYLWRDTASIHATKSQQFALESYYLDASDFLARLRVNYTPRELTRMESQILSLLDWNLMAHPTCAQFLEAMLAVAGAPHLAASPALRANFEAVVTSWSLMGAFGASTLALALLSLMFQSTFSIELVECMTHSLANIFKVDELKLDECRTQTAGVLRRFHSHAQLLQRNVAARSLTASPFLPASPMSLNSTLMYENTAATPKSSTDKESLPLQNCAENVDTEIVSVLYALLDGAQN